MKISKNSWHYKVWAYKRTTYEGMEPTNLCSYFWMVIWKLFIGIPFIVFSPIIGIRWNIENEIQANDIHFLVSMFLIWVSLLYSYLILPWTIISKVACDFTFGALVGVVLLSMMDFAEKKWPIFKKEIFKNKNNGSKFRTMIVEMFYAKKDKVCPTLELID